MPVRKSAIESEEMQAFFAENPNFKTAVDQLPLTKPQDSARVFIPNGDQIIGSGLERITVNREEAQPVFNDVAATLTYKAMVGANVFVLKVADQTLGSLLDVRV